jgi:hypothetical protein
MKIAYTYPLFVGVALIDLLVAGLAFYEGDLGHAAVRLIGGATLLVVIGGLRLSERNLATSRSLLVDAQAQYALARGARTPVVMPEITLDQHGRFAGVQFNVGDIPSGESVHFAIPVIHGLPVMEMTLTRAGTEAKSRMRINWQEGRIEVLGSDDADLQFSEERGGPTR